MKYIRSAFVLFLLFFLLLVNGTINVLAAETGFSTEPLEGKDIDTFLGNINISMLEREPPRKAIECFSVSESGVIAIGCGDFTSKIVSIYESDGSFRYGYRFVYDGNFGIELDGDILIIYFVRSDVALSVNSIGEVVSVLKIQNTLENNSYWNNCVFSTSRIIGDTKYVLRNDMGILNIFASSYSQLIVTNKSGEEQIVYNVNSAQFLKAVLMFICAFLFVSFVVVSLIKELIKLKPRG